MDHIQRRLHEQGAPSSSSAEAVGRMR
jgi:hypothetical protein